MADPRSGLVAQLRSYGRDHSGEIVQVDRFLEFVTRRADCFERSCEEGHVTASAWIVSPDSRKFLLIHHRKLGRWLQLGGHADGDTNPARVALAEAQEESGLDHFEFLPAGAVPTFFDLDIHAIPARPGEPRHFHYDLRYLLRASREGPLLISEESNDLRWFDLSLGDEVLREESVRRLQRKAAGLLELRA